MQFIAKKYWAKWLALLLVALLIGPEYLLAAVSTQRPTLPDPGTVNVSKQQQEQIGQKAKAEVYQQMPVLPDSSPVAQYVQQLGRKLDSVIPAEHNWPYEFHVIQQKEINAFALPGGPIFINVGTIVAAKDEAQLAGVMAHEMSHVYMQHSIKGAEKQQMTQGLAGIVGGILGGVLGGTVGGLAQAGAGLAGGLISLKYSRSDEAQADHVGAIIMYLAGYNAVEMANFFKQLETQGGAPPQMLSDHPNPGNRVAAVESEIQNWAPENWVNDSPQFQQVKVQAQQVKSYSAQQIEQMAKSGQIHNGAVPPGAGGLAAQPTSINAPPASAVLPASSMRNYAGDVFSINYPSNWQVMSGGQGGGGVTIGPQAGVVQGNIAYGVLINEAQGASGNLDQDVQQLVSAMQQGNPGLRRGQSPQAITINGRQARVVDLIGQSPISRSGKPEQERDRLVAIPTSDGNLLFAVFVAPEQDYSRLQAAYQNMLRSLQVR